MDDGLLVGCLEGFGNLPRDRQRLIERQRPAGDFFCEGFTLYKFHYQRAHPPRLFTAMDVRDVWVVERGEDVGLPLESSEAVRIVREERREDLDSDVAIQTRITGTIDLPHPSRANQRENLVRTQPRACIEAQRRCRSWAGVYAGGKSRGPEAQIEATA